MIVSFTIALPVSGPVFARLFQLRIEEEPDYNERVQ